MDEHVVHRLLERVGVDALRHRQVALRVHVDAEHAVALLDEGRREVERGGGLRHAALLVGEGDDLGLAGHGETPRVGWENHRPPIRARGRSPAARHNGMRGRLPSRTSRSARPARPHAGPRPRRDRLVPGQPRGARRCSSSSRSAAGSRSRASAPRRGARTGYGTALAAMLQTVAVMGPARINAPLTQAITAPMMGRLQARGARAADRVPRLPGAAARALRRPAGRVHLRDPRRDRRVHRLLRDAHGLARDRARRAPTAALAVTAAGQIAVGDLLQRDPGRRLPARARRLAARRRRPGDADAAPAPSRPSAARAASTRARSCSPRCSPRALLLASTSWALLLGVTAWLIPAWLLSRPDHDAVPLGLAARRPARVRRADRRAAERRRARADAAARRCARCCWSRSRPGCARRPARAGCARRSAARCTACARCPPCARRAALMEGLDPGPRLIAAGRAAADRFADVRARARRRWPTRSPPGSRPSPRATAPAPRGAAADAPARCARRTALLVALTLLPVLTLVGA